MVLVALLSGGVTGKAGSTVASSKGAMKVVATKGAIAVVTLAALTAMTAVVASLTAMTAVVASRAATAVATLSLDVVAAAMVVSRAATPHGGTHHPVVILPASGGTHHPVVILLASSGTHREEVATTPIMTARMWTRVRAGVRGMRAECRRATHHTRAPKSARHRSTLPRSRRLMI